MKNPPSGLVIHSASYVASIVLTAWDISVNKDCCLFGAYIKKFGKKEKGNRAGKGMGEWVGVFRRVGYFYFDPHPLC